MLKHAPLFLGEAGQSIHPY